jgi:hypothetical protein
MPLRHCFIVAAAAAEDVYTSSCFVVLRAAAATKTLEMRSS